MNINTNQVTSLNTDVAVYKVEKMLVANIDNPAKDTFFNNDFREVTFVKKSGEIFKNSILDGRVYSGLAEAGDLVEGAFVTVKYLISPAYGWTKTINGKEWH